MNTYVACGLVIGAVVVESFAGGYWFAGKKYQAEKAEFEAEAQAQYAQALEAKATREKYLQGKIEDAASNAKQAQSDIETRYQMLLDAAWSVSADVPGSGPADAVGMHADAGGASGESRLPATATATSRVSTSTSQRVGTDRAKLQRLYERQLEIAKDCDITASHYNELITLYEEASKQ